MATRLPYYTGDDDVYSRLVSQYAQQIPTYSAAPVSYSTPSGLLGGYDAGLYSSLGAPVSSAAVPAAISRLFSGGSGLLDSSPVTAGSPGDGSVPFDTMTPSQQAAYYAANPTMSSITQTLQNLFGYTTLGMLQNAMVPQFVQQQQMIAKGIDPYGMAGLPAQQQSNVNQALSAYLESSMNQPNEATTPSGSMGNDVAGFGSYGENVDPIGVEVGGPIVASDIVAADIGLLDSGAPAAAEASMGNDTAGFGSYGEMGGVVDAGGGGDGGGGGGSKMICTKLYHLGKMPEDIFVADQAFGALMAKQHPETYAGYALWARHVVRWMGREDWIGKAVVSIVHAIATPWSVAMAEEMGVKVKSGWFGRFLMKRGLQMCEFIGKMNQNRSLQNV